MGERADLGAIYKPWTDEEKALLENYIEYTYEDFVSKVDNGRKNLNKEEVYALAQGRIWTGEQAKNNGLIDDLGGLDTALEHMRELTGIEGSMRLVDATSSETGISIGISSNPMFNVLGLHALEEISQEYIKLYEFWQDFSEEKALMLSPINNNELQF